MRNRFFVYLCLVFCLVSCNSAKKQESWWDNNHKLKVLTTVSMINNFVEEIGGEYVDVLNLINNELDPHSYELVKGDDEKFTHAQVVFYNGLGLEHSLSLKQKLIHHSHAIAVADDILRKAPGAILYQDGQIDPHVWMDVSLWIYTVNPILEGLCALDPAHASFFQQRAAALKERLETADRLVYKTLQAIPSHKRYLITSHDAFHYFVRRYLAMPEEKEWRNRCAAPEGLAPDANLSITDIYNILNLIEQFHISTLFTESNVNKDALRKIVKAGKERGCQVKLAKRPLYGDSMGKATSYLEMISHNVDVIVHEFMQEEEKQ